MNTTLSAFLSKKFRFWSFISMVLLVFVHGYNLDTRYLEPWTLPGEPMTFSGFIEYLLANGIFRFRIPMLFIISGFLFALHDDQPHRKRVGKRFRTLIIPYLIWSALGLIFTWLLELNTLGREIVAGSNIMRIDDTRVLLHDYQWYEALARWILIPVPYQLWFIRVLFFYNLAYLWIRWCVMNRTGRWIFFTVAFLLWITTSGFIIFEGEGLLFFSLGVLIQKSGFDIEKPVQGLLPKTWGVIFLLLALGKTFLAFRGELLPGTIVFPLLAAMHKIMVFAGLTWAWFGLDGIVKWCMERQWFVWLSAFSFMIYAMHTPPVAYLINPVLEIFRPLPGYQLVAFFTLPVFIILLCVITAALLRKTWPGLYGILTGNRGFNLQKKNT